MLTIDSKRFSVLRMKLSFFQPMDVNGKPHANPGGGLITLELESSKDSHSFLGWVVSPVATKDGEIVYSERDGEALMKKIEFKKAYCVAYDENFDAMGSSPMTIHITISSKELSCHSVEINKEWDTQ